AADHPSTPEAVRAIDEQVRGFYAKNHVDVARAQSDAITRAIIELQAIYRENFFPEMRARWDVYPDNIGHFTFPGCFRCHDDRHRSADGKTIEKRCTSCHAITAQGRATALTFATDERGLTFEHPAEIGDLWKEMACNECHKGAIP